MMNIWDLIALFFPWAVVGLCCWLGWQLLRQNGRILLRLESIEDRLSLWKMDGDPSGNGKSKLLTRSRLNRNGLKAGMVAPNFRLPRVDGGELSLEEFRGQRVLLVFSDPQCGPCNQLAPELEKFHRENLARRRRNGTDRDRSPVAARPNEKAVLELDDRGEIEAAADGDRPQSECVAIVMVSRRDAAANRAKIKKHRLTFPVLLQQHWEVSLLYGMFATPIAYLIDEQGVIAKDLAVGVEAIRALMVNATNHVGQRELAYA